MTIALERYLAVCQPFKYANFTKSKVCVDFYLDVYYVDYLLWRLLVSGRFLHAFKLIKYDPDNR